MFTFYTYRENNIEGFFSDPERTNFHLKRIWVIRGNISIKKEKSAVYTSWIPASQTTCNQQRFDAFVKQKHTFAR